MGQAAAQNELVAFGFTLAAFRASRRPLGHWPETGLWEVSRKNVRRSGVRNERFWW